MKVSTDSRLLAGFATQIQSKRILDVGCGCGIIAILLGHSNINSMVVGIDIQEKAILAAKANLTINPAIANVQFQWIDFKNYQTNFLFDLIVSNPPYFIDQLNSKSELKSQYRHTQISFIEDFSKQCDMLLEESGRLLIAIPPQMESLWSYQLSKVSLSLCRLIEIKHMQSSEASIYICEYRKVFNKLTREEFILFDYNNVLSSRYKDLIQYEKEKLS
ncbi:MAG: methyltransferase [Saprospiraceae bacterium]|nr:methyltransferase [Saprospiraceae bacterium]